MQNLALYCNCFKDHLHRASQFDQRNLMCGAGAIAAHERTELTAQGYLFDDTGNNISQLNRYLGDLTGLYWVWKNTTDLWVGTNQYRRMWDTDQISRLNVDPNTLYVLQRVEFDQSAYDQYIYWHGQFGMTLLEQAVSKGQIDLPQLSQLKSMRYLHCNNMFFAHRPLFDLVCDKLFAVIFALYPKVSHILPSAPANQTRTLAFVAERILTVMFANAEYYFGSGIKIKEIGWSYDPNK